MKSFLDEFKAFAMRGNVVDLAVAVVIGAAFGKIVTSFTDDIIMPIVGVLTGGVDFSDLVWTLKEASGDVAAVTINYGAFINTIVSFVIVAFAIFLVVKAMNKMKAEEEVPEEDPKPTKEEELLTEIRDVLKNK
jgi:large conductance mechanosensitive channel